MEIKCNIKAKPGDTVWFINNAGSVMSGKITRCTVTVDEKGNAVPRYGAFSVEIPVPIKEGAFFLSERDCRLVQLEGKISDYEKSLRELREEHERLNGRRNGHPLPKLTVDVFNDSRCPKTATGAVVHPDGTGYWHSGKAEAEPSGWSVSGGLWSIPDIEFDASDWSNSAVVRPKPKKAKELEELEERAKSNE